MPASSRTAASASFEKAAGELKVRLRTALEEAVRGGETALEEPLLHVDRAVIGTIHSFCGTLLRESPVEARVDPNFAVADGLGRTLLVSRTWDAWLEEELSAGLPPALAEARAMGFTLDRARELADLLASNRDLIGHVPGPRGAGNSEDAGSTGDALDASARADADAFAALLEREATEFVRLAREHCESDADGGLRAILDFADAVSAASYLTGPARTSYLLKRVKPAPGPKQGNRTNWDASVLASLRERAAALRARQEELAALASHNAAVALVAWLRGFVERYEAEKVRAGVLDFDDLLLKARTLLRDDLAARERWKAAYERILVDEFQDTDPLQCEVVFFLSEVKGGRAREWHEVEIEPGKLFIVGDPKQSIYRFRRADIEMYERAKSVAGGLLHLTENFRTRPAIVAEVNAAFEGVMVPPEDGRKYQPAYEALSPARADTDVAPGVVLLTPPGGAPQGESVEDVRVEEARAVAAFLAEARDRGFFRVWDRAADSWRPAGLGDMAVLFRRTAALEAYEDAFTAYDLEFRVAGGRRFYARREVRELGAVLAAVDDPHSGVAVVGALRSPFLGVSDESILLHRLKAGSLNYLDGRRGAPEVDEAFALLARLHRSNTGRPASKVIRDVLSETQGLSLFLMKPDGEQRHANLEKVAELAEAMERTEPISLGSFVRWLADVSELSPEEEESPLSEEGGEFIRLLTIHKAKGLEFPVTVLADLSASDTKSDAMVVDRTEERLEFRIGGKDAGLSTIGYDDLNALEKERKRAESLRLLYVGMTRARDALVVPWFVKNGDAGQPGLLAHLAGTRERAGEPVRSLADARGRAVVSFDTGVLDLERGPKRPLRIDAERALALDPEGTRAAAELADWQARHAARGTGLHRPAAIRTPSGAEEHAAPTTPARGRPDEAGGLEFGSLVHAVMERVDFGKPAGARAIAASLARTAGLPASAAEQAADLVARALGSPVMRRAVASGRLFREVPFCIASGGEIVEGRSDLVFEEGDELVVVDYKTDLVKPGGAAALAERYRSQAESYAKALSDAFGKPVKEAVLLFLRGPEEVRLSGPHT
jgi:ATP-dependent exoDNAse (exonuclease V) beta subunit